MINLIITKIMLQVLWCAIVELVLSGLADWNKQLNIPPFEVRVRFYLAYILMRMLPYPW